jgi:propanediol dehydratase small subunit
MNSDAIESMVRDVLSRMNSLQGQPRLRHQPRHQAEPRIRPKLAIIRWQTNIRNG